jgi:hypothetical protein
MLCLHCHSQVLFILAGSEVLFTVSHRLLHSKLPAIHALHHTCRRSSWRCGSDEARYVLLLLFLLLVLVFVFLSVLVSVSVCLCPSMCWCVCVLVQVLLL